MTTKQQRFWDEVRRGFWGVVKSPTWWAILVGVPIVARLVLNLFRG